MFLMVGAMLFFGQEAYQKAKAYETATALLVAQMDAKSLAAFQAKEWAEKLTLGIYKNHQKEKMKSIRQQQRNARTEAKVKTLYVMGALMLLLLGYFWMPVTTFTLWGAVAAGVLLLFGLISPMMMVTIHKEVEYLGDVVLSFESKSVIGSIVKLFKGGDSVVAGVILLFSVIVPWLKVLSMLFVTLFMKNPFAKGVVKFFKHLGKWSMVDVFVVATFLVYLTSNKGDVSRAEIEVGLYFFLSYVIVSMLVSLSADKMLNQNRE